MTAVAAAAICVRSVTPEDGPLSSAAPHVTIVAIAVRLLRPGARSPAERDRLV